MFGCFGANLGLLDAGHGKEYEDGIYICHLAL